MELFRKSHQTLREGHKVHANRLIFKARINVSGSGSFLGTVPVQAVACAGKVQKFNEPFFIYARLMGERSEKEGAMNNGSVKKRINLDGIHSLDISVHEEKKTVVTELVTLDEEPVMIYAEKFDKPCNYLKIGIRRGLEYLNASAETVSRKSVSKNLKNFPKNSEPN